MEIDVEARTDLGSNPVYAECKCHSEPVTAPAYHAFFGKFASRYLKDEHAQGLFIALPCVNGAVWAFHEENAASVKRSIEILEQDRVVELVVAAGITVPEVLIESAVRPGHGSPGDRLMLYTDRGVFWAQYVIRPGDSTPTAALLLDQQGKHVVDEAFAELLSRACPELDGVDWIVDDLQPAQPSNADLGEAIVEVKASSSYFEYQFPASPEYFVGRHQSFLRFDAFVGDILTRTTSARSMLIEASSGWGKSSFVLSAVQRLSDSGHHAMAIDSRSASSGQFVLQLIAELPTLASLHEVLPEGMRNFPIPGFDGAMQQLVAIDEVLQERGELLFVFLDQFESVFFTPSVLDPIYDLFTRIVDHSGNVVIAFAWKTDLVGVMDDFPFMQRDEIRAVSHVIALPPFGEEETALVLDKLRSEMRVASLRQDLRFLLSEFSQGYPWLLMKLCAHVRAQKVLGAKQADIATSVLNVDELFREDMQGLSPQEEDVLRAIARAAPIAVADLGEEFDAAVVQRLLNRRLIVRIGSRYDVYWDIFRDFLNTGRLPIQENYILRMSAGAVLSRVKTLIDSGGELHMEDFISRVELSQRSLYNVVRDMRMLGLVEVADGSIRVKLSTDGDDVDGSFRVFLKDRLTRNRTAQGILAHLEEKERLSIGECTDLLAGLATYVSATSRTWRQYALVLADWLDFADLAVFDKHDGVIRQLSVGAEVRERSILPARRRSAFMLRVQYAPVEAVVERIAQAAAAQRAPEWTDFRKSTASKALRVLTDLGFLRRQGPSLILEPIALSFYRADAKSRGKIIGEQVLRDRAFAEFVAILNDEATGLLSNRSLGKALSSRLHLHWGDGTAETQAKIMLDWARQTGLAPARYASARRGPRRVGQQELPMPTEAERR